MTIYKADTYVDAYRFKATHSADVRELSGRSGRPDLTQFIIDTIMGKIRFEEDDVVVDIGCGDAALLCAIGSGAVHPFKGRLVGILPTREEVSRVYKALVERERSFIQILPGLSTGTGLPDAFADKIIINSVLLILADEAEVDRTLREIFRIAKKGATIYMGELPANDEFVARTYNDSMLGWLFWVLRKRGPTYFIRHFKKVMVGIWGREPVIITPKKLFFMEPSVFVKKLEAHGFKVLDHFRHKEVNLTGASLESATRWDYMVMQERGVSGTGNIEAMPVRAVG